MEHQIEVEFAELVGQRDHEESLLRLFATSAGSWVPLLSIKADSAAEHDEVFISWIPTPTRSPDDWRLVILVDEDSGVVLTATYNYRRLAVAHRTE